MKSLMLNRMTGLVMAVALAIGLAACGGGGGKKVDDTQRQADVAAARTAAETSYKAAEADATKAEGQADAAEATAAGTADAMAARDAATAARTAATAAKAAHDAIMDDMTKAEADAEAKKAADEAKTANSQYMTAKDKNDNIQSAKGIFDEQRRKAAIEDAQKYGGQSVTKAKNAADDAQDAADAAEMAYNNANTAYMQAMSARTDATGAKEHRDAAKTAWDAAQKAADDAEDAYEAAKAAIDGLTDDSTKAEADAARTTADTQAGTAAEHKTTAMKHQTAAEGAETKADTAADVSVLELFKMANADDVDGAKAKTTEVAAIGAAMAAAAKATNGNQAGTNNSFTALWPVLDFGGDGQGYPNEDTTDDVAGTLKIRVSGAGALPDITSALVDSDNNTPDNTTDDIKKNASKITGVSGFMHGFDIVKAATTGNTANTQVIAFTDKKQATAAVTGVSGLSYIRGVLGTETGQINGTVTKVDNTTGTTISGVEIDIDGTGSAPVLKGTLNCAADATCNITVNTDGTYTVTGYTFTGGRDGVKTKSADAMADYLLFGLWLNEVAAGTDTFGAFGTGGEPFSTENVNALKGSASYSGPAVGSHHKTGEGVSWFEGTANLTAKFGTATEAGKIGGTVSNIRVGGAAAMTDSIHLVETTIADGTSTFNGAAVMGAQSGVGSAKHAYNGTWSGGFFNNPTIATGDTDVSDNYPGSVAGTFGVTKTDTMGTTTGANATDDDVTESYVGAFGAHKQ